MRFSKRSRVILLVLLTFRVSSELPAAQTSFNPALALSQFYTSNVAFVSEEQSADTYTTLSLLFPLEIDTRKTEMQLSYGASYSAFNEFPTFDNWAHTFNAALHTSSNRTNSLSLNATIYRGQDQGRADSDLEGDNFLTERSTRTEGRFQVDYSDRFGKTWLWGIGASAEGLSYEEIFAGEANPPQDRDGLSANARIGRAISPTTSIGFRAEVAQNRYDVSGDQLVQYYSAGLHRSLSRQSTLDLSLGGFISELTPEFQLPGDSGDSDRSTGIQGTLAYARSFDKIDIRLDAAYRPSLGASRGGASTNSYVLFTIDRPLAKRVSGSLALRYARSEPIAEVLSGVQSSAIAGNLSWAVMRVLSLAFNANYVNQSSLGSGSIPTAADSDFVSAGVSLVWRPLATHRIAYLH